MPHFSRATVQLIVVASVFALIAVGISIPRTTAATPPALPTPPAALQTAFASGTFPAGTFPTPNGGQGTPPAALQTAIALGTFPAGAGPSGAGPGGAGLPPSAGSTAAPTRAATSCAMTQTSTFASTAFGTRWQQGEAILTNFWGPGETAGLQEAYKEAASGQRLTQYFDKGRMELGTSDAVTSGLLATELVTGKMQVGDTTFEKRAASTIPIAGDPDGGGPTYAMLGSTAATLLAATPAHSGTRVTATVSTSGAVTQSDATADTGPTSLAVYDSTTQHNVAAAFATFRDKAGIASIGYAISEPFIATVKVGGAQNQVMIQVFERRVLTYTADNPEAYRVEMGNIGQHYYRWRYC